MIEFTMMSGLFLRMTKEEEDNKNNSECNWEDKKMKLQCNESKPKD